MKLIVPPFLRTLEWREVSRPRFGEGDYWNVTQIVRTPVGTARRTPTTDSADDLHHLNMHLQTIDHILHHGIRHVEKTGSGQELTFTGGANFWRARDGERLLRFRGVYMRGRGCHYRPPDDLDIIPKDYPFRAAAGEWVSDVGLEVVLD